MVGTADQVAGSLVLVTLVKNLWLRTGLDMARIESVDRVGVVIESHLPRLAEVGRR